MHDLKNFQSLVISSRTRPQQGQDLNIITVCRAFIYKCKILKPTVSLSSKMHIGDVQSWLP